MLWPRYNGDEVALRVSACLISYAEMYQQMATPSLLPPPPPPPPPLWHSR